MGEARWDLLENPVVDGVLNNVASALGRKFSAVTSVDDVYQDGVLWLMQNADEVDEMVADGSPARLHRKMHDRLYNRYLTLSRRASKSISYEYLVERLTRGEDD